MENENSDLTNLDNDYEEKSNSQFEEIYWF